MVSFPKHGIDVSLESYQKIYKKKSNGGYERARVYCNGVERMLFHEKLVRLIRVM